MTKLLDEAIKVDIEIRKKLIELLNLRKKLEKMKEKEDNPIKEKEYDDNIQVIEEIIGKIRYSSLDELGILHPKFEEDENRKYVEPEE